MEKLNENPNIIDIVDNNTNLKNKIKGALYGAYIGDSIGSDIEFNPDPSTSEVNRAMKMNGSCLWFTAPGQITDDSELSLALGQALDSNILDLDNIAHWYGLWYNSNPYDIGTTTGNAFKSVSKIKK